MRSRYAAFALQLPAYLLDSWHSDTRPEQVELEPNWEWRRLIIESTTAGGPFDDTGVVTFTAIARTPDGRFVQRERSRFVREARRAHGDTNHAPLAAGARPRWVYLDGETLAG